MYKQMLCLLLFFELIYGGRVKRVVGGTEVECGRHVRIASLSNSTSKQHMCGATIVSPTYAVTAAHCGHHDPEDYILSLNNYCTSDNQTVPTAEVLEIVTHPSYNKYTRAHDIALLRIKLDLENTTSFTENLLPKCSIGVSGVCSVYGYGYKDVYNTDISDKLLAGNLRIISLDECIQLLDYVAPAPDSGLMCAVGNRVDTCQGDSGGPLMCGGLLEGICSHGISCGVPGMPGFYVGIGPHLRWIHDVINRTEF